MQWPCVHEMTVIRKLATISSPSLTYRAAAPNSSASDVGVPCRIDVRIVDLAPRIHMATNRQTNAAQRFILSAHFFPFVNLAHAQLASVFCHVGGAGSERGAYAVELLTDDVGHGGDGVDGQVDKDRRRRRPFWECALVLAPEYDKRPLIGASQNPSGLTSQRFVRSLLRDVRIIHHCVS